MGERFWHFFEVFTSCGGALLRTFGRFCVRGSTFEDFWKILRPVGEHFLELLEDLTSCGGALFGTFWRILGPVGERFSGFFGGFHVLWGSAFWGFGGFSALWGGTFLSFLEDFMSCGRGLF